MFLCEKVAIVAYERSRSKLGVTRKGEMRSKRIKVTNFLRKDRIVKK